MILFDPDQPEAASGFPLLAQQVAPPGASSIRPVLPALPTLARYLRESRIAAGLQGEVNVLLTTDKGIRSLNRRFRGKNKATDVLSFPAAAEMESDPAQNQSFDSSFAGDLAISVETAARQAADQGHPVSIEVRVLMLHGLLHLAGYDHEIDQGAMAAEEIRLRAKLRLPHGLIERVEAPYKTRLAAKPPHRKATPARKGRR